ncbi:hypothetical protein Thein_1266 [Thermodesulfatator indicus DSM 15286]|uniref:Cell division protein ZapA n=1 Tax=Thermodesulfatator indicus (strain DSM 15286 / JCM 11887 / CIR29812) TaxID=667014 RepID=F8A8P3_THEID|nr:hypothetical protein Thein_1266 [Thermodesulfatator indicus DSM 15286]
MERIVEIKLLDQVFAFKTDLPEEMVEEIREIISEKENEIRKKYHLLPPLKVAVLLLLQISSEYVKIKKEHEELKEALLKKASELDEYLKEVPWGARD